jgi:hypothetical protein
MKFAVRIIYTPAGGGTARTQLRLFGFGADVGNVLPLTTADAICLALDELGDRVATLAPLAVIAHGGLAAEAWANDAAQQEAAACAA